MPSARQDTAVPGRLRITSSAAFANAADHLIHQMRVPLIRKDDGHEN
jgi:hypothetical protein